MGLPNEERLAQSAGYHVAANDLDPDRKGDAILLHYVTMRDTPDSNPAAFRQQIRFLYLHITGLPLPPDATEPDELIEIWKYLHSVEASPTQAWAGVISAVLRDPSVLFAYALKCGLHYHHYTMSQQMAHEEMPLVSTM